MKVIGENMWGLPAWREKKKRGQILSDVLRNSVLRLTDHCFDTWSLVLYVIYAMFRHDMGNRVT